MALGIFSTYRAGENRVTSSLLAVLRSLSIDRMQRIVGAMLGEAATQVVSFNNQVACKEGKEVTVPDAEIRASFHLLIETKTTQNAVRADQLRGHLKCLRSGSETAQLLVITPDPHEPTAVTDLARKGQQGEGRIVWQSFADLNEAFDEMLADPAEVIGEREAFLVRELQAMFEADRLLEEPENVVVVAARNAWPFYLAHGIYTCPIEFPFRPVPYMAFYAEGHIQPQVAKIVPTPDAYDNISIAEAAEDDSDPWLRDKIREVVVIHPKWWGEGGSTHLFRLSPPQGKGGEHADETVILVRPIKNDQKNRHGGNTAFTYGRRYVHLDRLRNPDAKFTSDVVD